MKTELNDDSLLLLAELARKPDTKMTPARATTLAQLGAQNFRLGSSIPCCLNALQAAGLVCIHRTSDAYRVSITDAGLARHRALMTLLRTPLTA